MNETDADQLKRYRVELRERLQKHLPQMLAELESDKSLGSYLSSMANQALDRFHTVLSQHNLDPKVQGMANLQDKARTLQSHQALAEASAQEILTEMVPARVPEPTA